MKTVIEMAREAGLAKYGNGLREGIYPFIGSIERFAELVRADERDRFLQAVEEMRPVQDNPLLQNKPAEFWIRSFKQTVEARGNT